jgi:hypothetical protein
MRPSRATLPRDHQMTIGLMLAIMGITLLVAFLLMSIIRMPSAY